ncbi:single-stranded-DNA-specific exonuclease RecJ [Marinicella gelatinilytica]|uniref:single-stranded-DNA-specific exonuclease RecJ n=1 Tax=Marinicella gelatinilytica TaxID=2996017 RepID=UPI002260E820|nr:single-stranded-DNA-specific exonuclease RecJ [Marinicella gelatinilytica]MCX7545441.1 single-stranded-DNA-specific exonuclease RecJ [Marinicella gelatinilytica]
MVRINRRDISNEPLPGGEHLPPLIQRIYRARGIKDASQIEYSLKHLSHADAMPGIDQAATLIIEAIGQQKKLFIVGDFDADGATATALMVRVLRQLGADNIDYMVPNRFDYGYGLSEGLVDELAKHGCQFIVTVDNGISSTEGVKKAQTLGMQVVITDHHLPPATLPPADAIVNPNMKNSDFGSPALAGVGVAFYLLTRVIRQLKDVADYAHLSTAGVSLSRYLDLVALGTVADVVPLDHNNRILIAAGLKRLRQGTGNCGLLALCRAAGSDYSRADAQMLAFMLAPRLNAAGRLQDMQVGIELLLTEDPDRADQLAQELNVINKERKAIQANMQNMADSVIKTLKKDHKLSAAVCIYHSRWHQGVVGLLASKVKEYTQRPVVAFADEGEDSQWVKGSARSIDGLHIRDALVAVDRDNPGLIKKFGGHAMAAGLTLKKDHMAEFKKQLCQVVNDWVDNLPDHQQVDSDGAVPVEDLSLFMAQQLADAGPWGAAFEPPLFDDYFIVKEKKAVAEIHTRLRLQTMDLSKQIEAIAFNFIPHQFPEVDEKVHVCYQMQVNEFRNRQRLQLLIKHLV